jgi:ADP-ribose pyrophosphatase YjhB (NUDIX family)
MLINYCAQCGARVTLKVPPGDQLPRHVCDSCGTIHYQNPKIVAGCLIEWEDKIVLCKRAIDPRLGFWTLPAGFMENGESVQHAAAREAFEEAEARVEVGDMLSMISVPHIGQVHIFFHAKLVDGNIGVGAESLEVGLYREAEIPWRELAFPTVKQTLRRYYADLSEGARRVHVFEIAPPKAG